MSIRTILPALAVFSIIALSSCVKNDRSLGHQFITDDYILKLDTASFDVPLRNLTPDTVQALSTTNILLGYLSDPLWGATKMEGASFVLPLSDSTYFGVEPELLNVYLSLVIDSTVVYDPTQSGIPQNLYIYEMLSDLDSTRQFNNSINREDYSLEPISEGSPIIFGKSTIKIQLSEKFGKKLLETSKDEFKHLNLFKKKIKGLYLSTDMPSDVNEGGRLNYISFQNSVVYLDYQLTDPERGFYKKDTTETFIFGYQYAINQFQSGSHHLETDTPQDSLFLDGLAGVKPFIPSSSLKSEIDKWMDKISTDKGIPVDLLQDCIILSRASLVLPYEMPEDYEMFDREHPQTIFPCTRDPFAKDTSLFLIPVNDTKRISSPGYIDRDHKEYICDITSYIQDMIQNDAGEITPSSDLWIAPIYAYYSNSGATYYGFDNSNYNRVILNGPTAKRRPILKLTYSLFVD